jgi:gamma-glutamylcysteine synthetase
MAQVEQLEDMYGTSLKVRGHVWHNLNSQRTGMAQFEQSEDRYGTI